MAFAPVAAEIQKLAPSAIVELFELDYTSLGGEIARFHAGTNGLSGNVVWQGNAYVRIPIQVTGFELSTSGTLPRPKLQISNQNSVVTALLLAYDDLAGAKFTRKRTLAKFLDAVNFPGSINPSADSTASFVDEVFYLDRKSGENRDTVEFELASALDIAGVQIPRRQIIQNLCPWKYRGPECGWAETTSLTGTYSRTLTTVTVTATAHGLAQNDRLYVNATSGTLRSALYTVLTVPNANSFTFESIETGSITGNCQLTQLFDARENPVYFLAQDACGKRLASCRTRFGLVNRIPYGGFPGAGLTR